ncbi:MAG: DUF3617 domain-containing protein [Hyphomonadaceae bacterium]|nr:DUF3617 domain-containing protein [Hyphomonadaceae bacterium]
MRRVVIAALAALAACSPKPTGEAPAEPPAAPAAPASAAMTPGQWRTTVTITAMAIPGVPADAVAGIKARPFTSEECVTAQSLDAFLDKRTARNNQPENCTSVRRSTAGGRIDAQATCTDDSGQAHTVTMAGEYTPERVAMEVNVAGEGARGPQSQTMQVIAERIGACSG